MIRSHLTCLILLTSLCAIPETGHAETATYACEPTMEDEMGPLYIAGAAERNMVGIGYLLLGEVKSASDCKPVADAMIEIWMAGPEGLYGDDWRATIFSAGNGSYYFQSHPAPDYGTGRAHIHIKVTAAGFRPLVTQHYPSKNAGEEIFNLVLTPVPEIR